MDELHAFFGSEHVGTFRKTPEGAVFGYTAGYTGTPLSLSLPLDAEATPAAGLAFLDGLLPDRKEVRQRWARERDLPAADPFTLLSAYGEDVAGAVSLSCDPDLGIREPAPVIEATYDDIAARIATLAIDDTSWNDPRVKPRMSLAGAQGKFTLARVNDRWFWSTYETPSTHILKPPSRKFGKLDEFEHLGLELAREAGVEASRSEVAAFLGQTTFITARWDRAQGVRLHAEDANQALGRRTDDKYKVRADEVARLLARHGMADRFVAQLAFNTALGNGDAHAKNYSVLLSRNQVVLSPIYDTVPTYLWQNIDSQFAMPIGNARWPAQLTEKNWRAFAAAAGLDADQVCDRVFPVMAAVADRYEDVFAPAMVDDSARRRLIQKHAKVLSRTVPPRWASVAPPPVPPPVSRCG
jgi:serine/threonine-protein kinase HipA